MFKNYFLILAIFLINFSAKAQLRKCELQVGIGNNGQIERAINDYYYELSPLYLMDYTSKGEFSTFKYNIGLILNFNNHIGMRLRYGRSKTENTYDYNSSDLDGVFQIDQLITNLNTALRLSDGFGKFRFSTGLELVFYRVSNFNFSFDGVESIYSGNSINYLKHNLRVVADGGKAIGINNFLEIEYPFSNRFAFGASASYGLMYAKFGDQVSVTDKRSNISSSTYFSNSTNDYKSYKSKYFSAPEIMFHLIIKFGKELNPSDPSSTSVTK